MADATNQPAVEQSPASPDGTQDQRSAEYWQQEAKKAFQDRDAAKAKARELEAKAEELRKQEVERNQAYKAELDKLTPEYEALKAYKAAQDEKVEKALTDAEAKLDQAAKDEYERFIKQLPKDARLEWIQARSVRPVTESPATTRPGATTRPPAGGLASMSAQERIEFARKDPEGFRRAVKQK